MKPVSCMGGFCCPVRENCARYHAEDRSRVEERVCDSGITNRWIPITPEKEMPKAGHIPVELIEEMAGRPEGVSATEISVPKGYKYSTAARALSTMCERGALVSRRGPVRGSMTTRYWLSAEAAEKFEFPATMASETRDGVERLLREQHGTVREVAKRAGLSPKGAASVLYDLFHAGRIHRTEAVVGNCLPVHRFFGSTEAMEKWVSENGTLAEQQARNAVVMREARRQKLRDRYRQKNPEIARADGGKTKARAGTQQARDAAAANRISKTMEKSSKVATVKPSRLPPALQPGEPIITEQTKVTRAARPLGRYEVGTVGSSVFSANRPGVYDDEPSTWAAAAARLAA